MRRWGLREGKVYRGASVDPQRRSVKEEKREMFLQATSRRPRTSLVNPRATRLLRN